jgi:hypothetical protein
LALGKNGETQSAKCKKARDDHIFDFMEHSCQTL